MHKYIFCLSLCPNTAEKAQLMFPRDYGFVDRMNIQSHNKRNKTMSMVSYPMADKREARYSLGNERKQNTLFRKY